MGASPRARSAQADRPRLVRSGRGKSPFTILPLLVLCSAGAGARAGAGAVLTDCVWLQLSRWPLVEADTPHIPLPQPATQSTAGWYSQLGLVGLYNRFFLTRHLSDYTAKLSPAISLRIVNVTAQAISRWCRPWCRPMIMGSF